MAKIWPKSYKMKKGCLLKNNPFLSLKIQLSFYSFHVLAGFGINAD